MRTTNRSDAARKPAGRPPDPGVTEAILAATLRLLMVEGFAHMTMESIAAEAGVGKPAIYRRFKDKADVVVAAIGRNLAPVPAPDYDDTRRELHRVVEEILPRHMEAQLGLVGGVIAEQARHPAVVAAFRRSVLLPRRQLACQMIERGQRRGDVRPELDPEMALDMLVGQGLARGLAGLDVGERWRERAFQVWWDLIRTPLAPA
jgi:AcrR family transcriptional regulator